jgi:hypothetical protein
LELPKPVWVTHRGTARPALIVSDTEFSDFADFPEVFSNSVRPSEKLAPVIKIGDTRVALKTVASPVMHEMLGSTESDKIYFKMKRILLDIGPQWISLIPL